MPFIDLEPWAQDLGRSAADLERQLEPTIDADIIEYLHEAAE